MHRVPDQSTLSLKSFTDNFKKNNLDSIPPIMLTSYGGGLMADYWAMLVTHELQVKTEGKFLKHTFNLSGNSGGGVGFANYVNLAMHTPRDLSNPLWKERIDTVGNFNHLSHDLVRLFGRDMVTKFITGSDQYKD